MEQKVKYNPEIPEPGQSLGPCKAPRVLHVRLGKCPSSGKVSEWCDDHVLWSWKSIPHPPGKARLFQASLQDRHFHNYLMAALQSLGVQQYIRTAPAVAETGFHYIALGYPGAHYVDQVGLELTELCPPSASQVLGLKAFATMPVSAVEFLSFLALPPECWN